jgi:tetratricopeptide (TPR) repeat protein
MARYREGYEQAERGLALMRALKDERGIGLGLSMLGGNAWRMGDFLRAKACYKEELAIARKLEHRVPRALQNLAHAEHALGNFKRAEELLAEAAALDRRDGKLDYLAGDLANLARVAANQGNFSQAQALIDEAFELQAQVGERAFLGMTVAARIAMQRKDHARARELSERALGYFQQAGNLSHQVEVSLLLARTATAQGNYAKAQRHIGVGLNHAHATRARPLVFMSLLEVAHLRAATGQPEEAAPLLSLIAHHPTAEAIVKLEAKGLLEQITAALPADVIAEAIEQGRGLTPEEALDGVLRDQVSSGCAADARSDVPGNDFRFGANVTDEG